MRVKICGITTIPDALAAEKMGAGAVGVVVCSESPRNVPLARAEEIFSALGPLVTTVCVTHTKDPAVLDGIAAISPDAIQCSHPFPRPRKVSVKFFRAVAPGEPIPSDVDAIVVDASHGTGRRFDPAFAKSVIKASKRPVFLAGGLTPDNVTLAVRDLHPYAVDVASGVERAPGVKDHRKMQEFLNACRDL
ncbi:MAG: phosphoribosylanthranilate isomerase [Methanoregulaceae archaeon]|nr:phosphoribosylanthranilate isomerase [Methanoregulaceae archaeon]